MNSLKMLESESNLEESRLLPYEKVYATRHRFPEEAVRSHPKLQLAAQLEWQIANHIISVRHARRIFVEQYPESNRLAVGKTIIEDYGYRHQDERYALGSVLSLIEPYEDSIREL